MRVKELSLHGYKSFAGKHRLVFPKGITAIVGPNGSGKSNVADAIRWVLGEVRSAHLRAKRQEDLIFAGSDRRARQGLADVGLTFDNGDGWLDIDFSEVVVGRRVLRDGSSHFLINGSQVRLRDVVDLIGEKLGQGTFTVIGQGLVDHALALRPEDRRGLIDEAAGLVPLQRQRDRALRQLVEVDENLTRVQDILTELGPRLKRMARLADRAATHQKLADELRSLLETWYGYHWHQAASQLSAAQVGAAEAARELADAEAAGADAESVLREAQAEAEAQETSLVTWRRQREALLAAIAQARQLAAVQRAQAEAQRIRQLELLTMDTEATVAVDRRRAQLAEIEAEVDRLSQVAGETRAALDTALEAMQASERLDESAASRVEAARREQLALAADLARSTEQRSAAEAARRQRQTDRDTLSERAERLTEALVARRQAHEAALAAEASAEAVLQSLSSEMVDAEAALDGLRRDLVAAQDRRGVARREREAHQARVRTLEALVHEVEDHSVRRRLADEGAEVLGTVSELIEVEPGWETAVAAVLGTRIQALVLADKTAPQKAVASLDSNQPGQVWLLPARATVGESGQSAAERPSAAQGRAAGELPFALVGSTPVVSPAAVVTAPRAGDLVGRLFDGVLFVDDRPAAIVVLEHFMPGWSSDGAKVGAGTTSKPSARSDQGPEAGAKRAETSADQALRWARESANLPAELTVATRDGQVFCADGAVSVGAPGKALLELERERRELPKTLEAAAASEVEAEAEADRLADLRRQREHELGEILQARQQATTERSQAAKALEAAEVERRRVERESAWLGEQLAQLDAATKADDEAKTALDERIRGLEKRLAEVEAELGEATQARSAIDLSGPRLAHAEAAAKAATAAQALAGQRAMAEAAAADLAATSARLAEGQAKAGEAEAAVARLLAEAEANDAEAKAKDAELVELDRSIGTAESITGAGRGALREALASVDSQRGTMARVERRLAEERLAVSRAEGRLERLFDQLKADTEWLPWVGELPGGLTAAQMQAQLDGVIAISATSSDASEASVEAEVSAPAGHPKAALPSVDALPDDLERRIGILRRELRAIGGIDLEALATYEESAERHAFLSHEEADLTKAKTDLKEVLERLENEMSGRFEQAFNEVAGVFGEFFPQLFGGGEARLVMRAEEGGEAGVDIVARPPGKRSQPLSLLSGGERALTAVALIFALVKVSGTPFVVLDEVDAALDEANVGRFAGALQRLADETQVVIITHNRATIQTAATVYGITMGEDGASQAISVRVDELAA